MKLVRKFFIKRRATLQNGEQGIRLKSDREKNGLRRAAAIDKSWRRSSRGNELAVRMKKK